MKTMETLMIILSAIGAGMMLYGGIGFILDKQKEKANKKDRNPTKDAIYNPKEFRKPRR
mgnify:CR=1 FL=1